MEALSFFAPTQQGLVKEMTGLKAQSKRVRSIGRSPSTKHWAILLERYKFEKRPGSEGKGNAGGKTLLFR